MLTAATHLPLNHQLPGWHRSCVRVGEVSIGLNARDRQDIRLSRELDAFQIESSACDIELSIERVERLRRLPGKKLFDSGSLWTLYESGSDLTFDFTTPVLGRHPYKRLVVNREFSVARLLLNREHLLETDEVYPLEYPLDELLVTHWLACGRGVEVHGCGLVDHETGGHLFLGHSGAGRDHHVAVEGAAGCPHSERRSHHPARTGGQVLDARDSMARRRGFCSCGQLNDQPDFFPGARPRE